MNIYQPINKHCSKCHQLLPIENFSKRKDSKDGFRSYCKCCESINQKEYYHQTIDQRLEQKKQYYLTKKDQINQSHKEWYNNNKQVRKEYNRKWYLKNRVEQVAKSKEYYQSNKSELLEYDKAYKKNKRNTDPLYRLKGDLRSLVGKSISNNGYTKKSRTYNILGCSYDEFYSHIEKQFLDGMNWDNRSEWHLDHIVPLALGESEEDILLLNHYTNIRPLWSIDNLTKGDSITLESINHPIYEQLLQRKKL